MLSRTKTKTFTFVGISFKILAAVELQMSFDIWAIIRQVIKKNRTFSWFKFSSSITVDWIAIFSTASSASEEEMNVPKSNAFSS